MNTINNDKNLKKIFLEETEKFIVALGNNYIQNYLVNGKVHNGFAIVSNKRVYFKGKSYERIGKKVVKGREESVVDLKDVTGTGYTRENLTWLLVVAISLPILGILIALVSSGSGEAKENGMYFLGISMLISLVISIIYSAKRQNNFYIKFAGGQIEVDTAWYGKDEIDNFQKQLRLAKDNAILENQQGMAIKTINSYQTDNVAEEIRKYADLLKEELITKDEYDKLKDKLLN